MGSRMKCRCGYLVFTNHFYKLVKDIDYDAMEKPANEDVLSEFFFKKGMTAYLCPACGRLIVEWEEPGGATFYQPEKKEVETPEATPGAETPVLAEYGPHKDPISGAGVTMSESGASGGPEDLRLKELEAIAEHAYAEMYDSNSPTASYSEAKEAFHDAIAYARSIGRRKDVERLERRLEHVKNVFRHQFT